jgi:hypothetical protein
VKEDKSIQTPTKNILSGYYFAIIAIWLIFNGVCKTVFSGYHLMDDHMFLDICEKYDTLSFWEVLKTLLLDDLSIRFRPLYWLLKAIQIGLFGDNLFLHSVFTMALGTSSNYLLFSAGLRVGLKPMQSLICSLLILAGYQTSIWWMLGPAENFGVFTLCIGVHQLAIYCDKGRLVNKILFFVQLVLASLIKESFLILIPAALLCSLVVDYKKNSQNLALTVKSNFLAIGITMTFFFMVLYIIIFKIGSNSISYARIDQTWNFTSYLQSFKFLIFDKTLWMVLISLAVPVLSANRKKEALNRALGCLFLLVLFIVPQGVLYAKSGFVSRYLQPTYLILGIFMAIQFLWSNKDGKFWGNVLTGVVVLFLAARIVFNVYPSAQEFNKEGKINNALFAKVKQLSKPKEPVVIVTDVGVDFEATYSIAKYISHFYGLSSVFLLVRTENRSDHNEKLFVSFKQRNQNSLASEPRTGQLVIVLPAVTKSLTINPTLFEPSLQEQERIGDFLIYKQF